MHRSTQNLSLAAEAAIDLHLHTTYSDGRWQPEQLLDYLAQAQFGLAAITDHDRPDTAHALQKLAREKGLPLLVGVEMTTVWQDEYTDQRRDERSGFLEMTDLLCYGFDPDRQALRDIAQGLWQRQRENTRAVYQNLLEQGYHLPQSLAVLTEIVEKPNPEQPHALVALVKESGYGEGERSAGQIVLEAGCAFAMNDLAAVVAAVHHDGGVCLLAHPGHSEGGFVTYDELRLDKLRSEVPVDGLEVYHPKHTPAQTEIYRKYAEQHHLLISAGSDSHHSDKPPIIYPAKICRALLERVGIQLV